MKKIFSIVLALSLFCALFTFPATANETVGPGITTHSMIREKGEVYWQSNYALLMPGRTYEFRVNVYNTSGANISDLRISAEPLMWSTIDRISGVVFVGDEPTVYYSEYRKDGPISLTPVTGSTVLDKNIGGTSNNFENISDEFANGNYDIILPGAYGPGWVADLKFEFTVAVASTPTTPLTPELHAFAEIYNVYSDEPGTQKVTSLENGGTYEYQLHVNFRNVDEPVYLFFNPIPTSVNGNLTIGGAVETRSVNSPLPNSYFGAFATTNSNNVFLSYVPGSGWVDSDMEFAQGHGQGSQQLPDSFGVDGLVRLSPDEPDKIFEVPDGTALLFGQITLSFQFTVTAAASDNPPPPPAPIPITSLKINAAKQVPVISGKANPFTATVNNGASVNDIIWTVNNPSFATVTAEDGGCSVTVIKKNGSVNLTATDPTGKVKDSIVLQIQ